MHTPVLQFMKHMQYGNVQLFNQLTILPILNGQDTGPVYLTLAEAAEADLIDIGEVSSGGSVPTIRAINKADQPILIIDGEELIGAKQNRVVNTTILLKEKAETLLPVSCTEQGRWHSVSPKFQDADNVMAHKIRHAKHRSVSASLQRSREFHANQGEVWSEIQDMACKGQVHSPTGAMQDVYKAHHSSLADCLAAMPVQDRQVGLIAVVKGQVVGMDFVSRSSAYRRLHGKILKSYAMDVVLCQTSGADPGPAIIDNATIHSLARAFVVHLTEACAERHFASVGHGVDFRYESPTACGSALVHEETAIHGAFFVDEPNSDDRSASGPTGPGLEGGDRGAGRMDHYRQRRSRLRRKDQDETVE